MSIALKDADDGLFSNYETEFQLAYGEISQNLDEFVHLTAAEQRKTATGIQRAIDEAYEIIDQMAVEVQSIPSSQRSRYNNKLRGYRSDIEKAKRRLKGLRENVDRNELLGEASQGVGRDVGADQRQQLLAGQESLDRSSERLRESQRVANETESVGANILTDLRAQREQIVNSRNTLTEADNYVDKSLRTLRSMARRMAANKVITYAIIAILVVLIIFVLLSKFW